MLRHEFDQGLIGFPFDRRRGQIYFEPIFFLYDPVLFGVRLDADV